MLNPANIPQGRRRWPGYRGDAALLNVEVICLNCGHATYNVEATTPATWSRFIDFLEEGSTCANCNLPGFQQPARIYEGRILAGSVYHGQSVV